MTHERPTIFRSGMLIIGGWLVMSASQFGMLVASDVEWQLALDDTIISQLLLCLSAFGVSLLIRFYHPERKSLGHLLQSLLEWTVMMAGLVSFLQYEILLWVITDHDYLTFIDRTVPIRVFINWLLILLSAAAIWMWHYYQEQQDIQERKQASDQLMKDAELSALRQQLHPHFLFNSLNSISALAGSQPEQARKMVQQLSDFLRGTLRKDDRQMVTLEEELNHLQLYLDIEKVRFGHRLKTVIEKEENCLQAKLPSLLLQPIVENAIKFGLYDTVDEISIRVRVWMKDTLLHVEVINPFDPSTAVPRTGTGFGLSSIQRRLFLLFSRSDLLTTFQKDNYFTTHIQIPQPS